MGEAVAPSTAERDVSEDEVDAEEPEDVAGEQDSLDADSPDPEAHAEVEVDGPQAPTVASASADSGSAVATKRVTPRDGVRVRPNP